MLKFTGIRMDRLGAVRGLRPRAELSAITTRKARQLVYPEDVAARSRSDRHSPITSRGRPQHRSVSLRRASRSFSGPQARRLLTSAGSNSASRFAHTAAARSARSVVFDASASVASRAERARAWQRFTHDPTGARDPEPDAALAAGRAARSDLDERVLRQPRALCHRGGRGGAEPLAPLLVAGALLALLGAPRLRAAARGGGDDERPLAVSRPRA